MSNNNFEPNFNFPEIEMPAHQRALRAALLAHGRKNSQGFWKKYLYMPNFKKILPMFLTATAGLALIVFLALSPILSSHNKAQAAQQLINKAILRYDQLSPEQKSLLDQQFKAQTSANAETELQAAKTAKDLSHESDQTAANGNTISLVSFTDAQGRKIILGLDQNGNPVSLAVSGSPGQAGVSNFLVVPGTNAPASLPAQQAASPNLPTSDNVTDQQALNTSANSIASSSAPTAIPSPIAITAPVSGEYVPQTNPYTITWDSTGNISTVSVALTQNGKYLYDIADGILNTGSFIWTVPVTYTGSGFRISISAAGFAPATSGIFGISSLNRNLISVKPDGSPASPVGYGQAQATLAKFDFTTGPEAVKIKFIGFGLTFQGPTPVTNTTLSSQIRNLTLSDDANGQIGATIAAPPSANVCDYGGQAGVQAETGVQFYVDCFGSPQDGLDYQIPANTTRVITIKGDIPEGATVSSIETDLVGSGNYSNAEGLTSHQIWYTGGASGYQIYFGPAKNSQAPAAGSLLGSDNGDFNPSTLTSDSNQQKIASYIITASKTEDIKITTLSLGLNGPFGIANLANIFMSTPSGNTQPINSSPTNTFPVNFTVPAGQSVNIDAYADIGNSTGTITSTLSANGYGQTSNAAVSLSGMSGQTVLVGQPSGN